MRALPPIRHTTARATVVDSLGSPKLLGGLKDFRDLSTWRRWIVNLKAAYGIEMTPEERRIFTEHTHRETPDPEGYDEIVDIVGRQAGKSKIAGADADHVAMSAPPSDTELGVALVSQDERNTMRVLLKYIKQPFRLAALRPFLKGQTTTTASLINNVTISTYPGNRPESIRGPQNLAGYVDELAFLRSTTGNPTDKEVLRALRPSLALHHGKLWIFSSPFGQFGELFNLYQKHWAVEGSRTLIWCGSAPQMNPCLPPDYLKRMERDDPEAFQSEVLGIFRAGLSLLFDPETLDRCTEDVTERAPDPRRWYLGFRDGSSGRQDGAGLSIWHLEDGYLVQDLARYWPAPHRPDDVVSETAALLHRYGIDTVYGDLYSIGFQEAAFAPYGITYQRSAVDSSRLCLEMLSLVNQGKVKLLNHPEQRRQLAGLERRTASNGRDKVTHSRTHDDVAVACCGGAVTLAALLETEVLTPPPATRAVLAAEGALSFGRAFGFVTEEQINNVVFDEDLGLSMDDLDYPARW